MSLLKYPGVTYIFGLHLNMFTTPAYFVILCSIVAILLLLFCYNGQLNEAPVAVTKELKGWFFYFGKFRVFLILDFFSLKFRAFFLNSESLKNSWFFLNYVNFGSFFVNSESFKISGVFWVMQILDFFVNFESLKT